MSRSGASVRREATVRTLCSIRTKTHVPPTVKRYMVKTTQYQTIARSAFLWILVLLVVPFMARPVTATSSAGAPDVAKIDAFVRDRVQRHGIPGLALALVDGDKIIHLGGYGKADQSGRPVRSEER